jgi:hypothetical protein
MEPNHQRIGTKGRESEGSSWSKIWDHIVFPVLEKYWHKFDFPRKSERLWLQAIHCRCDISHPPKWMDERKPLIVIQIIMITRQQRLGTANTVL